MKLGVSKKKISPGFDNSIKAAVMGKISLITFVSDTKAIYAKKFAVKGSVN